jgi:hypothetical protein
LHHRGHIPAQRHGLSTATLTITDNISTGLHNVPLQEGKQLGNAPVVKEQNCCPIDFLA